VASKGKVPIEIMLKRRNFSLASRCVICFHEEESVDHLFVYYQWVSSLWALTLSLMAVSWVQSSIVKDVLVAWRRRLKKCRIHGIWKLIRIAI